jgi:hypothetical protein
MTMSKQQSMVKFNPSTAILGSKSSRLLDLIDLSESTPDGWQRADIIAMVRHQYMAPLAFDLSATENHGREARARARSLSDGAAARIKTFEDLLLHREPPLPLLKLAKEFFKQGTQAHKKDSPEWQVAYLFYLLSILISRIHGANISALSSAELRQGIEWASSRDWADEKTKSLLARCRHSLPTKV